jgi:hypothetical protein
LESSHDTILIDSRSDRFTNNSVGLALNGGQAVTTGTEAQSNVLVFHAHADTIDQNDVPLDPSLLCQSHQVVSCFPSGGGLLSTGGAGHASANLVHVALVDTSLSGNQDGDINAWGAFSANGVIPGTDNHLEILLKRVTGQAVISAVDSEPPDPNGTNTVLVVHHGRQ